MQLKTLSGIDPLKVLHAFNEGFSDYMVPVQLTAEQWHIKILSENVQWELSVGAFDEEKLVGIILHGSKTRNGQQWVYNGGTAVIPSYRGQRLTQQMYAYILPILKAKNIDKVLLEVIDQNYRAIKTYGTIGFKNTRRLPCFKGHFQNKKVSSFEIKPLETLDWDLLQSFWSIQPSWQNDIEAIMSIQNQLKTLGIYSEGALTGYLTYNPVSNKILQLAVDPAQRLKGMASALLHEAFKDTDKPLLMTNIDNSSTETIAFLKNLGMENMITQHEMCHELI